MCVTSSHLTFSRDSKDSTSQSRQDISFFRRMSAHCLVLSDYTKPTVNTVEALMLYFFGSFIERQDNRFANYLVFTTIVRVAMRAGYHRDSLHFPEISAFDGEYRRRVWLMILQFDVLMSFEMGLPRMINDVETDTEIPRILCDGNLSPDMTELPPSRYEDNSILRYVIVRMGILLVLGKIQDRVVSIHPLSYETVAQLDKYLDEQYTSVPSSLKAHHGYSITETPNDLLQRLMLDILFQKARCSLHRRFMNTHPTSYKRCIDASLRIISHQSYMYHESRAGGFLCRHTWKIMCAATYDFLLATIIICLGVYSKAGSRQAVPPGVDPNAYEGREDLLKALEEAYTIWTEWSTEMHKAGVVFDIVKSVLKRVQRQRNAAPVYQNHHSEPVESPGKFFPHETFLPPEIHSPVLAIYRCHSYRTLQKLNLPILSTLLTLCIHQLPPQAQATTFPFSLIQM